MFRLTVVSAMAAALALAGCTPASATDVKVPHSLFGLHDGTGTSSSFGQAHEGAVRLWDVGVQWRDIERTRGHYTWARLDQLVSAAQAAHAEVTMVVAGTPHFYSADPWTVPAKKFPAYRAFVAALMHRYRSFHGKRGISAYQVWNEGNITTFWTSTPARLAALTRAMAQVRNRNDRGAKVIAPPMVTRLRFEMRGIGSFYRQRPGGRAVWRYVDAVALSLYPTELVGRRLGTPEDSIRLLHGAKSQLRHAGVPRSKPIWNTEINYGLGSGAARRITPARQIANVMRTYLLDAANGLKRVFWYRWDWGQLPGGGTFGNTLLTSPVNSSAVTPAGRAFLRIQHWMRGTLVGSRTKRPCRADRHGTYTCVVRNSSGLHRIYWNPFHAATVRLAGNAHHLTNEFGARSRVRPHHALKVGYQPVLVGR